MEALHARGLTSIAKVMEIPSSSFQNALTGTVAYQDASAILNAAKGIPWSGGSGDDAPPGTGFQPINAGNLVDCIPPCHLSPLGPVQYLYDLLALSDGTQTLGAVLATRRGNFGDLGVTAANLDLPLPLLDIVNENLEAYGASIHSSQTYHGPMFNTLDEGLSALDIRGTNKLQVPATLTEVDLLRALPQHSTPRTLTSPNVYDTLKTAVGSPNLPYSQGLDVGRTYLTALGMSRFETMRTFQKAITELPQSASLEPASFNNTLWRFPVRHDIAIEYLCISLDEAATIFGGDMRGNTVLELFGFQNFEDVSPVTILEVSYFLQTSGLSYCEFLELHGCGIVPFTPNTFPPDAEFPPCLPCCSDSLSMRIEGDSTLGEVLKLLIFVRLWRRLKNRCHGELSMKILADICTVLQLFTTSNVNGNFIIQLSSLLMLKEVWNLPWMHHDTQNPNAPPGDQRTKLLALWVAADKGTPQYKRAVEALLDGVEKHSVATFMCAERSALWRKIIVENLDDLASLAGFDGTTYRWESTPTCTIRFAEVLSKIYASKFTVGEILFMFTPRKHLRGDDPFEITDEEDSKDNPLNLPEDDGSWDLWALRRKLLEVDVCDEEARKWTWSRIEATLHEMGYKQTQKYYGDLLSYVGERFFPDVLEQEGRPVAPRNRRFETQIAAGATSAQTWLQAGECSPFRFEARGEQPGVLYAKLPLRNSDVLQALRDLRQLNASEAEAVQNLYLEPRAAMAPFALVFANFDHATDHMIQERCAHKRFAFFQHEFARFVARCRIIAHFLHDSVSVAAGIDSGNCQCALGDGCECAGMKVAWQILVRLIADENRPSQPWENPSDSGAPPQQFNFPPGLTGGAFASLLGLTGTGLLGKYFVGSGHKTIWRETRGGLSGWGSSNDYWNSPLITLIPSLTVVANTEQSLIASFKNGFALNEASGHSLSGAESFSVTWTGVLLVEHGGCYHFAMSCPYHTGDNGECHCARVKQWSLTLKRGEKTWHLLHQGMEEDSAVPRSYSDSVSLRRGAYDIFVQFRQLEPDFDNPDDLQRFHTGFVLKYMGPDTEDCLVKVPMKSLYLKEKVGRFNSGRGDGEGDGNERVPALSQLQDGIHDRYISSLRDIRRTYQRAFKAVLFAHRFCLAACRSSCEWENELGYILDHPDKFQGASYYLNNGSFHAHYAYLDFNFLPVRDNYFPPDESVDDRVAPSWKRQAAMLDWFERIFDYVRLRRWVCDTRETPLWLLFYHANLDTAQPVAQLVRYLDVEIALAKLVLEYIDGNTLWDITNTANVSVLSDERWSTRVWMAGWYVRRLRKHFSAPTSELVQCRPALWAASPDGNAQIDSTTGNANLTRFVQRCCLAENDTPPRLNEIITLNDGLCLRARGALLAFLEFNGYPSLDLADHLLLDVDADIGETTTRIDDAIAAAQRFMQRVILGFEGQTFTPDGKLLRRWESEFSTFDKWHAARRRQWYFENWVQWEDASKLSECEGFQSLKKALKADVTTVTLPARGQYWTQSRLPSENKKLGIASDQYFALTNRDSEECRDEGLQVLGSADRGARPTWLAVAPLLGQSNDNGEDNAKVDDVKAATGKEGAQIILPGVESLDGIPLWIQSAIRLGITFLRVAASSLPIGIPYTYHDKSYCCRCKREHPPVIDEYYFWLEDARRLDPLDAPAPQNADQHVNTPGINPPTSTDGPQIDPRTVLADPTSDWDSPTPQMLSWKPEPIVYLRWTRVHLGQLEDSRRSTDGITLTDTQVNKVDLDIVGRSWDSLFFNVFQATFGELGFRYDIASDSAVVLPEAITSPNPPALPLPSSLSLAAFPYFLYFELGAPLVPLHTFSTSLVVASSLRADCKYEEASDWLRFAYDPLDRDNTWMQCTAVRETDRSKTKTKAKATAKAKAKAKHTDTAFSDSNRDIFAISVGKSGTLNHEEEGRRPLPDVPCCPSSPVKGAKARGRAAILEYLKTLLEWARALQCRNSFESSQHAVTLLGIAERILGPKPKIVKATDTTQGQMTLATFEAYAAPLNWQLMELYDDVHDSLSDIRANLNKMRLQNGLLGLDYAAFGSHQRFDIGAHGEAHDHEACDSLCCFSCCHPYRFSSILPKAMAWAALAKSTATSMLSAIEKADNEALNSLRLAQERQITELGLEISKNTYRAADWDVQALEMQMSNAITRLQYFQKLIQDGLNTGENAHVFAVTASIASRTSATVVDGVAQGMSSVPDMWLGTAGVYGSPLQFEQMPMGVKLGTGFATAARILNTVSDISGTAGGLSLTKSGWDRREQEWQHTVDVTVTEIQQIKRQRLASLRRLDIALKELNNTQRRIEHSAEVQDFARDKTSRFELYLYLQQENAVLYRQCYRLAMRTALETQQAVRYELGDPNLSYIPSEAASWDNLHEGLLAGEKLEIALYAMERAYMNKNCREFEMIKHISLRLHFPQAFMLLKATGYCEVDLPEWFFDLDYPGHYMRRIRSVSLTVPCVAGPYTGVHCKLQQLSSIIRFRPLRSNKDTCKCCDKAKKSEKETLVLSPCPNDPNIWRRYTGAEAISTSTGQNDPGLFELNFNDPRYLPFEYSGAVSRWRIQLPPDNNQFDFDSLSDLIMHVNFTSREGSSEFARESNALAQCHVPGDGWRFFDIRHELPEVWNVLRKEFVCELCKQKEDPGCGDYEKYGRCRCGKEKHNCICEARHEHEIRSKGDKGGKGWCDMCKRSHGGEEGMRSTHDEDDDRAREIHSHEDGEHHKQHHRKKAPSHSRREFHLELTRNKFPFLSSRRSVAVTSVHLLLDTRACDPATAKIRFTPPHRPGGAACVESEEISLVRGEGGLLRGSVHLGQPVVLEDGPCGFGWRGEGLVGIFSLPCELSGLCGAWLLCRYQSRDMECCTEAAVGCCEP